MSKPTQNRELPEEIKQKAIAEQMIRYGDLTTSSHHEGACHTAGATFGYFLALDSQSSEIERLRKEVEVKSKTIAVLLNKYK